MALSHRTLTLKAARGLVVRPRPGGGPDQALVFLDDGGVHELEGVGPDAKLGPKLAALAADGAWQGSPAYDPASDAVYFAPAPAPPSGSTPRAPVAAFPGFVSKLDARNRFRDVAGSGERGFTDGAGVAARAARITTLAPDGKGGVWMSDWEWIRRLDTRSGEVTTLGGVNRPGRVHMPNGRWCNQLRFDPATDTLWTTTRTAVWRVRVDGGGNGSGSGGGVELVAGDWQQQGSVDGSGTAARFDLITDALPVSGGRLLIADCLDLRCMDAGGAVTTLLRGCFPSGEYRQMAILPSGELGVMMQNGRLVLVSGGEWASPVPPPPAATTDLLLSLLAPQAAAEDAGGSGSGDASVAPGTVTVRVGGRAFPAHRSVLAAGSEYFARLLAPGGGFAESGAAEVALPDADPAAFAHLLSYMYGTSLGLPCTQLLAVPAELLRPTAALAGRLQLAGAVAALTERLAAAATPASVLSDLAWADAHGMTDLAERLRAYAVWNRRSVVAQGDLVAEFAKYWPQQAAELLKAFAEAF
ncbi:hypothetical protein HYH03_008458 [Edaphochlamys debaryana]|uniref:BTB domain-containing protein n=1 Tax=Edaphochlamys debaryana TaxID=47281 RepID=A0A835XZV2_9CHLO|nr:hypothetical protein HYH03_008458 [Edaphochlamys debaryana]|eukprot:KAG2493323.1 hypothetical protein HYH03_008458 [Edaphochlamys debaryana]